MEKIKIIDFSVLEEQHFISTHRALSDDYAFANEQEMALGGSHGLLLMY